VNISTEMLFITTSLASDALDATELLIDYCNGSETEIRGDALSLVMQFIWCTVVAGTSAWRCYNRWDVKMKTGFLHQRRQRKLRAIDSIDVLVTNLRPFAEEKHPSTSGQTILLTFRAPTVDSRWKPTALQLRGSQLNRQQGN
jgi:hypothetical protein